MPRIIKTEKRFRKRYSGARARSSQGAQMMVVPSATARAITERKYFDSEKGATNLTAGSTSWAGGEYDPATANTLFFPTLGDDFNNRTGRKVQVLGINIRGAVTVAVQDDQAGADNSCQVRIVVVQDLLSNGAQLNVEDVINSGAATALTANYMFSNPAFFGRFRILKDKSFTIENPNLSHDGTNHEQNGLARQFHYRIMFRKPVVVHYNATNGGTIADVIDNSFHVIAQVSNTNLAPQILYKCRTTFIDV